MNNFVISMYDKTQHEAGPKAKVDVVNFLAKLGFESIVFYFNGARKAELLSLKQAAWDIPRQISKEKMQVALFQYPALNERSNVAILNAVKKRKSKIFLLLHDVESLRLHRDDIEYVKHEVSFFNQSDGIIAHNQKMVKWLKSVGVIKPIVSLQIFDYDNPQKMLTHDEYHGTVCFAGNLKKSEFLSKMKMQTKIYLYGPNQAQKYPENVSYQGSFDPNELPKYLKQDFGLIWDGDSLDECNGVFGEYLKYNNPHKTSLYLSSGLPVIIWEKAALADFVKENRIGLTIKSLCELDETLTHINIQDYFEMCKNVATIGEKLRSGYYITEATTKLVKLT
ncbi:sugar transferase [Liquorilactobacillus cacaonum]|uniref:Beta-1,6-galactofuranosyltransferase n=1 Tax=Liquorilactobacillus cacaonum DSM 21116 TaxID=1423729 RepID=A0A0R2CVL6_9LACO|nr:sugar transferase [Liquorilactobacillus cacaonum]KRM91964.1 beta-1,6-galactofuranosyltransferase [Liquorilactobacillus cacaonum DSM 21116]